MNLIKVFGLSLFFGLVISCDAPKKADINVLPAHSHNDYEQARPLFEALDNQFKSIEADVYLIGDSLFVAHDFEEIKPGRTLRSLYLDPLNNIVQQNNGYIYGKGEELILLVDIKSHGLETYKQLDNILQDYKSMLSLFEWDKKKQGAVTVIISGNRPFDYMMNQPSRLAAYDGRFQDLEKDIPVTLMPLVSDNWTKYFAWRGQGDFPPTEKELLDNFVKQARNKGYLIRFWGTPNTPLENRNAVWDTLINAGVDIIGTDDIKDLHGFFIKRVTK